MNEPKPYNRLHGCWPAVQSIAVALHGGTTRPCSLRLLLFCTCPPLCPGALWPMPAWVWRDVRCGFSFFLCFNYLNTILLWRGVLRWFNSYRVQYLAWTW